MKPRTLTQEYRVRFAMADENGTEPMRNVAKHAQIVSDAWQQVADGMNGLADSCEALCVEPVDDGRQWEQVVPEPAAPDEDNTGKLVDMTDPAELLNFAWGVIANTSEGDWSTQTDQWREAAENWRDSYHQLLDDMKATETFGTPLPTPSERWDEVMQRDLNRWADHIEEAA